MPSSRATSASAGGKIILLGEHSVVYGHPALAGAIDKTVTACSTPIEGDSSLSVPAWDIEVSTRDEGAPAQALRALIEATGAQPTRLDVTADLPCAAGLGSSAALCLAVARCLAPGASDAEHRDIAGAGEAQFHHRPSGIDVALSQQGGIASYTVDGGLVPLDVPGLPLVVGLSGVCRSTATQVARVAARVADDGGLTSGRIKDMGGIVTAGIDALSSGDLDALGVCMSQCHRALRDIGVSIATLDAMVATAMEAGALGAKLTGAGGGGAIIALAPGREQQVCAALEEQDFQAFVTTLGANS
ncbi:MAG: mevalonate kinase [Myxococcales bacterium]|nr:mevalonate kinase [Myxococcales bacterium]